MSVLRFLPMVLLAVALVCAAWAFARDRRREAQLIDPSCCAAPDLDENGVCLNCEEQAP